jgi:hypothetical protein
MIIVMDAEISYGLSSARGSVDLITVNFDRRVSWVQLPSLCQVFPPQLETYRNQQSVQLEGATSDLLGWWSSSKVKQSRTCV